MPAAGEARAAARKSGSDFHEHVAEEFPGAAALGEVGRVGAGRGEVALDRRAHLLDPWRVELPAQASDAVDVVVGDVRLRDGRNKLAKERG